MILPMAMLNLQYTANNMMVVHVYLAQVFETLAATFFRRGWAPCICIGVLCQALAQRRHLSCSRAVPSVFGLLGTHV